MPRKKKEEIEVLAAESVIKSEPEISKIEAADTVETRIIKRTDYVVIDIRETRQITDLIDKGYTLVGGPFVRYNIAYQALVGKQTEILKLD